MQIKKEALHTIDYHFYQFGDRWNLVHVIPVYLHDTYTFPLQAQGGGIGGTWFMSYLPTCMIPIPFPYKPYEVGSVELGFMLQDSLILTCVNPIPSQRGLVELGFMESICLCAHLPLMAKINNLPIDYYSLLTHTCAVPSTDRFYEASGRREP